MHKVLIADDDLNFQKILRAGLQRYESRFEVNFANDGQGAITVMRQMPISFLVTDVQMPKVDGLALVAFMTENYPDIPCIVMTGHGSPRLREKFPPDIYHYLEKPFSFDELAKIIIAGIEGDHPEGYLKGITLSSFLQLIEMEHKTCFLEVESPDKGKGYIYFQNGEPFNANYGKLNGEEALIEILTMDRTKIRLLNLSGTRVIRRIESGLMSLILEAMKRRDESNFV